MKSRDFKEFILVFTNAIFTFVRRIGEGISGILSGTKELMKSMLHTIVNPLRTLFRAVVEVFRKLLEKTSTLLSAVFKRLKASLASLKAWMLRGAKHIYYKYLVPYYRRLRRFFVIAKRMLSLFLHRAFQLIIVFLGRGKRAVQQVVRLTISILRRAGHLVMVPLLFILRKVYSFFSALTRIFYRILRWVVLSLFKALVRILLAFVRLGSSTYLLLLPVYDYAVYWFNTYHPVLALVGRSGIAFLRVGKSTGRIVSRLIIRVARAFSTTVRFSKHILIALLTTVWLLLLVPSRFMFRLGVVFLQLLYGSFVATFALIRKLTVFLALRIRWAVKAVWSLAFLFVVPVLIFIGRTMTKFFLLTAAVVASFLCVLGRVVLSVLKQMKKIVVFVATPFLSVMKHVGHIISLTARMTYRVLSKILKTTARFLLSAARFLYRVVTAPIKRTGVAFTRSIVSVVACALVLGSLFSLIFLKISVPLAFFFSRNYLAWYRLLYTFFRNIAQGVAMVSNIILRGISFLKQNIRAIGEMTGIFSPSIGGVVWFLFTGSMFSLLVAGVYFVGITISSYLYNRWKQGDVNV